MSLSEVSFTNDHILVSFCEPIDKKLDLRGQYLDPAMALFHEFYHRMKKMYTHGGYKEEDRYIYVVTGYGKFSENKLPKIKPAVQSFLDKNKVRYRWLNPGLVMIDFCKKADEEKHLDADTKSDVLINNNEMMRKILMLKMFRRSLKQK